MKESDIVRTILDYLALRRIFAFRNNTGAFKTESGGFVRFGSKGSPDILCCYKGRFIGIECKRAGNTLSEDQVTFKDALEAADGLYVIAYSLDDVIEFFSTPQE